MKIEIRWEITGHDHDGYCSGEDAEGEEEDKWEEKEIRTVHHLTADDFIEGRIRPDLLKTFDYTSDGCTQMTKHGSGFCIGMYQKYRAKSISMVI